ncbi:MAG: hypothetical protein PF505_09595 [Vallitaleaceae bacterium]|jgi:PHD/YefM family antitoxin component YafN of YafNO toxin-antitoxin module|nr:hypothetical protein [Vallitaleaceae bacterium]
MNEIINSTEARKNWSEVIDTVVRKRPVFIKRNRDVMTFLSLDQLDILLDSFRLTITVLNEEDGTYTGVIEELDLLSNADTVEGLIENLAFELADYSEEYMGNFDMYYHSTNRKAHFPYIYRVIAHEGELDKIKSMFNIKAEEKIHA